MEPPDPLYVLRGCASPVTSLLYYTPITDVTDKTDDPTTPMLLSGSQTGCVHVWDLSTWRSVSVTQVHSDTVLSIHRRPTRQHALLTQGRDGWIHEWRFAGSTLTKIDSLQTPNPAFCPVACLTLANADVLVLPTENQSQVDIVSMDTKQTVMSLKPAEGVRTRGMCMHIKSNTANHPPDLLVGYEDGSIASWDLRMGSREIDCMKFHAETLMAFDYHAGVNRGLSASVDCTLAAWTLTASGEFTKLRDVDITGAGVGCVRFRHDGKLVVAGGWDGRIRAFTAKRQSPLVVLEQHKQSVQCIDFSPGGMLAVGSKDKHISVWNIYS